MFCYSRFEIPVQQLPSTSSSDRIETLHSKHVRGSSPLSLHCSPTFSLTGSNIRPSPIEGILGNGAVSPNLDGSRRHGTLRINGKWKYMDTGIVKALVRVSPTDFISGFLGDYLSCEGYKNVLISITCATAQSTFHYRSSIYPFTNYTRLFIRSLRLLLP